VSKSGNRRNEKTSGVTVCLELAVPDTP
jgi:hypothetical protein